MLSRDRKKDNEGSWQKKDLPEPGGREALRSWVSAVPAAAAVCQSAACLPQPPPSTSASTRGQTWLLGTHHIKNTGASLTLRCPIQHTTKNEHMATSDPTPNHSWMLKALTTLQPTLPACSLLCTPLCLPLVVRTLAEVLCLPLLKCAYIHPPFIPWRHAPPRHWVSDGSFLKVRVNIHQ